MRIVTTEFIDLQTDSKIDELIESARQELRRRTDNGRAWGLLIPALLRRVDELTRRVDELATVVDDVSATK